MKNRKIGKPKNQKIGKSENRRSRTLKIEIREILESKNIKILPKLAVIHLQTVSLKFQFQVTFSAKVDPEDKIVFNLHYEELLQRQNGQYQYQLNIQPKNQVIKDLSIYIKINESLPLKDVSVQKIKSRGEIVSKAESLTNETLEFFGPNQPHLAEISYDLPFQEQRKDWKLSLNYDVERPQDGSDVQIAGGRFVHYFAPDNLPTVNICLLVCKLAGNLKLLTVSKSAVNSLLFNFEIGWKFKFVYIFEIGGKFRFIYNIEFSGKFRSVYFLECLKLAGNLNSFIF